jgi:hypothetical protein
MARQYSFRTPQALYQQYIDFRATKAVHEQADMDVAFEELLNLFCDDVTIATNDANQPLVPSPHAAEMQILILPLRFTISVHHENGHVWIHGITYTHP